jgi:hypothetical protein
MAMAKERKSAFLTQHPKCYSCETADATTIDHVPARECFKGGIGPESFEFPACAWCNHLTSQIEQAVALWIRLADFDDTTLDDAQFIKLVKGVGNNTPHLLPIPEASLRDKRNLLRAIGYQRPPGESVADAPVMAMSPSYRPVFTTFARKLTCALFYREVGRPLPRANLIRTAFFQFADPAAPATVNAFLKMFPSFVHAQRRNTSIGNQFLYIWGSKPEADLFAFCAQFSRSYFVVGATTSSNVAGDREGWTPRSDDLG